MFYKLFPKLKSKGDLQKLAVKKYPSKSKAITQPTKMQLGTDKRLAKNKKQTDHDKIDSSSEKLENLYSIPMAIELLNHNIQEILARHDHYDAEIKELTKLHYHNIVCISKTLHWRIDKDHKLGIKCKPANDVSNRSIIDVINRLDKLIARQDRYDEEMKELIKAVKPIALKDHTGGSDKKIKHTVKGKGSNPLMLIRSEIPGKTLLNS